ncbi:MAG: formate/nitrite transporter family protein [Bacteroidales bacterium]|nr:formate/nitrite transporter family protein [Bacteroidales bacterium]MDD3299200.1 formate/nitrite transporter family protein [Bacteroidales bacterium]MDD3843710.1 formate/nitrite transporter family protein [Bacteroidales bacterium]
MKNFLTPSEIKDYTLETGIKKASFPFGKTMLLSFLAGLFIALASVGSNVIAHNIDDIGLAKYLAGLIFPTGLILVVVAGAELFTGNNLISIATLDKKVTLSKFVKNLALVWTGNLAGSVFVAVLIFYSGQLDYSEGLLGAYSIKVGVLKTNMTYLNLFTSGILCNILVCLAVWMSYGATDIAGKALVIFFPIWLFIASGFEHSVANMYYISAALMASSNPEFMDLAMNTYNFDLESFENLTWVGMFTNNLLPVTIGNLTGGALFVGAWYYWSYKK